MISEQKKNRIDVLMDVNRERDRQDSKLRIQHHDYPTCLTILVKEVGDVAMAIQQDHGLVENIDSINLYEKLIQVAAVAVSIAEQVKKSGDDT